MTWNIWTIAPYTGDIRDLVASFSNRGHAIFAIRGLRRRSWQAVLEVQYALRKG